MSVTIRGYSDDIVNIEGDIADEVYPENDIIWLSFSGGHLVKVLYCPDATWHISVVEPVDHVTYEHTPSDSDDYSDTLVIHDDIDWVVAGKGIRV